MRKRVNLIFILILGVILLLSMAACNQNTVDPDKLPSDVVSDDSGNKNLTASLKFEFPVEMSSVFNSISLDDFNLSEYVTYSVVYTDKNGVVQKVVKGGSVTQQMVFEDDVKYLSMPGHHDIRVKVELSETSTVTGSFKLHLKKGGSAISLVTYTFNLRDTNGGGTAYPYFASDIDTDRGIATKTLEAGNVIESWDEFLSIFKMSLTGKALESATTQGVKLSATSNAFPFEINKNESFSLAWTDDVINVSYDLNLPKDAIKRSDAEDPIPMFEEGGDYYGLTAQRRVGRIIRPDDEAINVYNGYYFGGWFNKADDKLWRFSSAVGNEDIQLYAKWVLADYTFTIYTMGGRFADNIEASKDYSGDTPVTITRDNAERLKYTIVDCASRFGLSDGSLNRLTFTGFHYDVSYDKYVAEVPITPDGEKVMLKFSEFYRPTDADQTILIKGDGDYVKLTELYSDYQCTVPLDRGHGKVNAEQPVTYVRWDFNEPESSPNYQEIFDSRITKYYTELVFKGQGTGYQVLADGSVRLKQITDWTVNELVVPRYLKFGNIERPVTEIGESALSNSKALTTVDLSRASALTTFGTLAFAYDDSLSTIVMPTDNAISVIGDDAFKGTNFETNYFELNHGAEFIVIGKMIYKYVGKSDKTIIDLSNPASYYTAANSPDMSEAERARFNGELAGVTSIENGAFTRCPDLAELRVPANLASIKNGALSDLQYFRTLVVPATGSKLLDIGETAFDNTPFLSTRGNLYDSFLKAIVIGNVYYRLLDKTATSVKIPSVREEYDVTHIAPKAFMDCKALATVNFDAEEKIVSVGREAFLDTAYARNKSNPFTIVNGTLVNYYGPTIDANAKNLIVPDKAKVIGTYAFGKQAAYYNTLQIGAGVKSIDDYAFIGSVSLASLIFPEITVRNSALVGAPDISEYAFAGESGEMIADVILYFSEDVIKLFNDILDKKTISTDPITLKWVSLYELNREHFKVEEISSVVIDRKKISTNLMRTGERASAFADTYGVAPVEDALIITSNTGVARTADLSWSANGMKEILVTADGDYAQYFEAGVKKYVLTYTYNSKTTGCPTAAGDPNLFIVTVHESIKGAPSFFSSKDYPQNATRISANTLASTGNFWFEGLDSQVADARIPTYYTSNPGLSVVFKYLDIYGNPQTLTPSRIDDLRTNAVTDRTFATIYVDFYGLGTFVFDFEYAVKKSKFIAIEQISPVNVPVNGNAAEFMNACNVNLVGQDGIKQHFALTRSLFNVVKVDGKNTSEVNVSTLGMHVMTIEYVRDDALNRLTYDIYYTVVLEADENLFEYETFNDSYNTARIVKCTAPTNVTTLVLPSRCTIGGKEYIVAQIGFIQAEYKGVFENYTELSSVYLPETIENIGVNTFRGCRRLQHVYTANQAVSQAVSIPTDDKHFEIVGESYKETDTQGIEWTIKPVKLLTISDITLRANDEIIIGSDYVLDATKHEKYRIVAVKDFKLQVEANKIDVYLPDTVYSPVKVTDVNDAVITPIFYKSNSSFMIKAAEHAPENLDYIGVGAFNGCSNLLSIDLTQTVNLTFIGGLAFANSGLRSVDLTHNTKLLDLNNQVFENCVALSTVKLHGGIKNIGVNAFSGDIMLLSVEGLGESLATVDVNAFNRCRSLTRFDIYQGLKMLGSNAFAACNALTLYCHFDAAQLPVSWGSTWNGSCPIVWNCDSNSVATDGMIYEIIDGIRYALKADTKEATVAKQIFALKGEIVLPDTVTYSGATYKVVEIADDAFIDNDKIISVSAGKNLKKINPNAFKGCTELLSFTLPDGNNLEYVASTAFENCNKLNQRPQVEMSVTNPND